MTDDHRRGARFPDNRSSTSAETFSVDQRSFERLADLVEFVQSDAQGRHHHDDVPQRPEPHAIPHDEFADAAAHTLFPREGLFGKRVAHQFDAGNQAALAHVADQRVGTFSRGMRQRLGVAEILMKQPQLVIMDEPTQGLDPEASREFLDFIRQLKQQGITILLSSHLLYQVQAVCDRVGLFHRGRMALEGTVQELAKKVLGSGYRVFVEASGNQEAIQNALAALKGASEVRVVGNNRYEIAATQDLRPEAAKAVIEAGGKLFSLAVEEPNLEEIYARYFKEVEHGEAA
ncbi:MAG: ABC transporter ATP-binding protein [Ardenticatenia bacterium]|nr:MAG: ABC transporter ATP-binding protein [Ardenticatenia bacterium]